MFSGIVEKQAEVLYFKIDNSTNIATLKLNFTPNLLQNLVIGASVAINGCCLSLINKSKNSASFEIVTETLNKTNLAQLQVGDFVNIERALKMGDEIGGHLLSGHIFTTIAFLGIKNNKNLHRFELAKNTSSYIFTKGFVALNGASLTVCEISKKEFSIALIPHTLDNSNLSKLKPLDRVNLEIDSQTQIIVDSINRQKQ